MNDNATALERRITLRLLAYWEKLRKGRDMPCEQDITVEDIRDLWSSCFIIHINNIEAGDYRFTHIGDAIVHAYRSGLYEDNPEALISPNASTLSRRYADILATAKPIVDEGEFCNLQGELVKYRQCLLPLGENGRITAIFGGMRYKVFAA